MQQYVEPLTPGAQAHTAARHRGLVKIVHMQNAYIYIYKYKATHMCRKSQTYTHVIHVDGERKIATQPESNVHVAVRTAIGTASTLSVSVEGRR